ncbi:AbrB/MazE/SpoVT family DNA-binding domain-containing protein [Paenibacillus periandrae]|uniref:AbrB/MazE/SpoVT family DNA-binding domain-containing protein n=1 Tax=Paenibacillus periandrae TaxID=1761741 RepID=UPI001F08D1C6|nr:AbrB/MazE/SpoVT family DNA-binding domain-containing protein [Paenibacillus periandrae]
MSSQNMKQNNEFKLPSDAHTLKNMMSVILEKSLVNMDRLRDREQILHLLGLLKNPDALQGGLRRIKSTGVVRNLDDLGRFTLPAELRRVMGIAKQDHVDIYLEGDWIIVQAHRQFCHFCGSEKDINEFKGKFICETCIGDLFNTVDNNE